MVTHVNPNPLVYHAFFTCPYMSMYRVRTPAKPLIFQPFPSFPPWSRLGLYPKDGLQGGGRQAVGASFPWPLLVRAFRSVSCECRASRNGYAFPPKPLQGEAPSFSGASVASVHSNLVRFSL